MTTVSVSEAKSHLSRLLRSVEQGEEVVITRDGKPVAKLVPFYRAGLPEPGALKDRVRMSDDFDQPLPDTFWVGRE